MCYNDGVTVNFEVKVVLILLLMVMCINYFWGIKMNIRELVACFDLSGEVTEIKESNTGNINRTYIVSTIDNGILRKYTLQRVNVSVFKDPYLLMNNIVSVTDYCKKYLSENGEDAERGTLSVIRTTDGDMIYKTSTGEYYRMYNYVTDTRTYDKSENAEMFYNVGIAFGHFVRMLDNYPIDNLKETIPNFHNSKVRFNSFVEDVQRDVCGRVKEVLPEIEFITDRRDELSTIVDMIESGDIPVRVTHNDTKINNVLIDDITGKAVCVIDLDTVMPGSALYDFGDAIRSGASKTVEDDTDLANVGINMEFFRSFTEAYLSQTGDILTKSELQYLAFSCRLLALELAMRFLNDYINGDVYFKCNYDKHNLDRARNQIQLVRDMEVHYEEMVKIVDECVVKVKIRKLDKDHN